MTKFLASLDDSKPAGQRFNTRTRDEVLAVINSGDLDEIDWYANLAAFPATGVADMLYGARDTSRLYRWNGSGYGQLVDKATVGLALVDNTPDASKPVSGPQADAIAAVGTVAAGAIPKSLVDAKGDLFVGTADNTVARLPIGAAAQVLTVDPAQPGGMKWASPAAGGATAGAGLLGSGAPAGTEYTFNHGQNSRRIMPALYDRVTNEQLWVPSTIVSPNSVKFSPSVLWAVDRIAVTVFAFPGDDVTAPSQPTVNLVSKTVSTIDVTATGSTDAVGVSVFRWWLNGVLVGQTTTNAFQFAFLNGFTDYVCGCTTRDAAGNESNLGTLTVKTNAPSAVAFEAAAAVGGRAVATDPTAAWQFDVPSNIPNLCLWVPVVVSHDDWMNLSDSAVDYTGAGVVSSVDGPLTRLGRAVPIGFGTQLQGAVELWYKINATPGVRHNMTAQRQADNISAGRHVQAVTATSLAYSGVGAVESRTTAAWVSGSDTPTSLTHATSAVGDVIAFAAGGSQAFAGFNRTTRPSPAGSAIGGLGDYMLVGEAPGAAGAVVFSDTAAKIWGAISARLRRAGS